MTSRRGRRGLRFPWFTDRGRPSTVESLRPREVEVSTDEDRKRAYKAFKKRIKLTRLDDQSGLSRGGSKQSGIAGITPPSGFPAGIWDELVTEGKLKRQGGGTYSLSQ